MEKSVNRFSRRLPVTTLYNARDLGGWPVAGGGRTKFGVFVRCARPCGLSAEDMDYLRRYGIRLSLDFRAPSETALLPSDFSSVDWAEYRNLPLLNDTAETGRQTDAAAKLRALPETVDWGDIYVEMTEPGMDWVREGLTLAAESDGAVLFHCFTGKDRAGIFAALLLGLAGVAEEDIIADYTVSQIYLMPVYQTMRFRFRPGRTGPDMTDGFYRTPPENMQKYLANLRSRWGGVEGYVRAAGVTEETIARLRAKFTDKG